jgi:hypothetical protein
MPKQGAIRAKIPLNPPFPKGEVFLNPPFQRGENTVNPPLWKRGVRGYFKNAVQIQPFKNLILDRCVN